MSDLESCTLTFNQVSFSYSRKNTILNDFNLNLRTGATAILGENGAGKSTLFKIALGLLRPKTGQARFTLNQHYLEGKELIRRVGYVPQNVGPIGNFTAREQVEYAAWLKGLGHREAKQAALAALQLVGLADQTNSKVRGLSGGQIRRVAIAMALAHSPDFLFLDEPTASLDSDQRKAINRLMSQLGKQCVVVVSTHLLEDLEGTFDQVVLLKNGAVGYQGKVEEFLNLEIHDQNSLVQ